MTMSGLSIAFQKLFSLKLNGILPTYVLSSHSYSLAYEELQATIYLVMD